MKWYEKKKDNNDIVIASRIRLSRNVKDLPFSEKMDREQAEELTNRVRTFVDEANEDSIVELKFRPLSEMKERKRMSLAESSMLSQRMVKKEVAGGLASTYDESLSVMVNEMDHLRIQAIIGGKDMTSAYSMANTMDEMMSRDFEYAYSEKYGFLTSRPSEIGTGLRASYLLHIPFIEYNKQVGLINEELTNMGYKLRGKYGEGTTPGGSVYQISNLRTLGVSEMEIIAGLDVVTEQIIEREMRLRHGMLKKDPLAIEDRICKAYGILKYARRLTLKEAMGCLSNLRFGLSEGIIGPEDDFDIHRLMIEIQPANLSIKAGKDLPAEERDEFRADYIREKLANTDI
ncbi:MAG: hypothetical protein IJL97_04410 [Lachnospiraceae bacterium]|nr:hypothetical protein [Lachnospiraceae bacterium]